MKVTTKKGFTLAELLIVMAIIVVLAAVAIPTFGKQLETSRETGDMEVIRNAYTEALSIAILDAADGKINGKLNDPEGNATSSTDANAYGAVYWVANSGEGADGGAYKVVVDKMSSAKFTQKRVGTAALTADTVNTAANVGAWTYVSDKLMGRTVPPVCTETKSITFNFEITSTGEVALVADDNTPKPFVMGIA